MKDEEKKNEIESTDLRSIQQKWPLDGAGFLHFFVAKDTYFTFATRAEARPNASIEFTPDDFINDYRSILASGWDADFTFLTQKQHGCDSVFFLWMWTDESFFFFSAWCQCELRQICECHWLARDSETSKFGWKSCERWGNHCKLLWNPLWSDV